VFDFSEDASGTIRDLRSVLGRDPYIAVRDQNTHSRADIKSTNDVEHSDYTYGSAAERLRNLLTAASPVQQSTQKTVLFSLPRRVSVVHNYSVAYDVLCLFRLLHPSARL